MSAAQIDRWFQEPPNAVKAAKMIKAIAEDSEIRSRILNAAEELFAKNGLETSIREITELANVNIAAVNYYFSSKTALSEAIFEQLSQRINIKRLSDLESLLSLARNECRPPSLRDIVLAFIRPYFEPGSDGKLLARLILQSRIAPTSLTKVIVERHFDPMAKRFIEAFSLACPSVEASKFYRRYEFMVGTVVFTISDPAGGSRMRRLSNGRIDVDDPDVASSLVSFVIGGLSADDGLVPDQSG